MKPISYTRNGDDVVFKYALSDLKNLISSCKEQGRGVMFLIKVVDRFETYRYIRCDDSKISFGKYIKKYGGNIDYLIENEMNPKPIFEMYDEFGQPNFEFVLMPMGNVLNNENKDGYIPLRKRFKH